MLAVRFGGQGMSTLAARLARWVLMGMPPLDYLGHNAARAAQKIIMDKVYHVSMACLVPYNFEISVRATSAREAYLKARKAFEENDYEGAINEGDFFEVEGVSPACCGRVETN